MVRKQIKANLDPSLTVKQGFCFSFLKVFVLLILTLRLEAAKAKIQDEKNLKDST